MKAEAVALSKHEGTREDPLARIPSLAARPEFASARRHPRFTLEVGVTIYSPAVGPFTGKTVEISESGMSVILAADLELGQPVELKFKLPLGAVKAQAVVRQRNGDRYGFEFVDPNPAIYLIRESCCLLPRVG